MGKLLMMIKEEKRGGKGPILIQARTLRTAWRPRASSDATHQLEEQLPELHDAMKCIVGAGQFTQGRYGTQSFRPNGKD